jgi:hypothetical protein
MSQSHTHAIFVFPDMAAVPCEEARLASWNITRREMVCKWAQENPEFKEITDKWVANKSFKLGFLCNSLRGLPTTLQQLLVPTYCEQLHIPTSASVWPILSLYLGL